MNGKLGAPRELVNLDRYPIDDLDSDRGRRLLDECRAELAHDNGCNLLGFLRPTAVEALARESQSWIGEAYEKTVTRNPYHSRDDPGLPSDHPARRFATYSTLQLAYDQIPRTSLLGRLYHWSALTDFIAVVLGYQRLYLMADRFQALNVIWLRHGESSSPHFDFNDFTVTLLLEAPRSGGEFEFVSDIRSRDDEHYEAVKAILDGDRSRVQTMVRGAGTLTLFRGRHSLHWVTPVSAGRRSSAILCYDERPDCVAADTVNLQVYGERIRPLLGSGSGRRDPR